MIEIIGLLEGKEYDAALHIRRLLLNLWPDLAQSLEDVVKIFVGFKLYGYKVEDLDLIVIGSFAAARPFDVEFQFFSPDDEPFVPKTATVKNFGLIIEAKSHDATGVRFDNTITSVRYYRGGKHVWENVTEKNRQQMFEFLKYLARHGVDHIYLQDMILLTGLRENDLPKRPHNVIASDSSFERILNILGQISRPRKKAHVELAFGSDQKFERVLSPTFSLFDRIEPTPLDRRRMDMIAKKSLPETWLDDLGERQIVVKGRGGVGKTVILLQMAYRAFELRQYRSLLLTFNKALVADLRRTMALLGVPRSVESGGIGIETAHGFFGKLMMGLGIIKSYDGFIANYAEHKETLLQYLKSNTITQEDINNLLVEDATDFAWDLVFVDEGQDWPGDEIKILRAVYGAERLTISDGVDQYVRDSVADWSGGLPRNFVRSRRLTRCMRMKSNLASFVRDIANELQLNDWDLEPNTDAAGGRVIVIEGDLTSNASILTQLSSEALKLGNYPVDMLACVPPAMVRHGANQLCSPAANYAAHGGLVWDGTARDVREHFPTDREQLRFVQYDSCRGLEGWTTVLYGVDELWEYKYRQWLSEGHEVDDLYLKAEDAARLHASQWVMIPLTRSIDTLIVNVTGGPSVFKSALASVHRKNADFIEWHGPNS